jgi:predicted nucleic acid-binding protein
MRVFFDSSAFIKRYLQEAGSERVLHYCSQATELAISGILLPEIISAFCRLRRENVLTVSQYRQLKQALLTDIVDVLICDLQAEVLDKALLALETNTLRGMDAIHIGSAQALQVDVFISSDKRQCEAATQVGLNVVMI